MSEDEVEKMKEDIEEEDKAAAEAEKALGNDSDIDDLDI
jgi:hypothetical protein